MSTAYATRCLFFVLGYNLQYIIWLHGEKSLLNTYLRACVYSEALKSCGFLWFLKHRKKALTKVSHFFWVSTKKEKKEREKHSHWGALRKREAVKATMEIQMENASWSPCCSCSFCLTEGGWAELREFGTCMTRVCRVSNLAVPWWWGMLNNVIKSGFA